MTDETYEPQTAQAALSIKASAFAGIGIGLMVGAILGLSYSPVVAQFAGAVGAALAALLGLNDRHFSTAKGVRIGCFGLAVLVAALSGIYIRDHKLLAPMLPSEQGDQVQKLSLVEKKSLYSSLGFTPEETKSFLKAEIMHQYDVADGTVASKNTVSQGEFAEVSTNSGREMGGLHATPTSVTTCNNLDSEKVDALKPSALFSRFKKDTKGEDSAKWSKLFPPILALKNEGSLTLDEVKIALIAARDAACGIRDFNNRPLLPDKNTQCSRSGGASKPFIGWDQEWQIVESRVSSFANENGKIKTLETIGLFLCE